MLVYQMVKNFFSLIGFILRGMRIHSNTLNIFPCNINYCYLGALRRAERDEDGVVLVLPRRRVALDAEHAHDLHVHVLDPDGGADRVLELSEEVREHGPAQQTDRAGIV